MQTFCGVTTDGMQEYLAMIYRLVQSQSDSGKSDDEIKITTSILAETMNVSPAAVSSMLKRLEGMGLIKRSNPRGIALSEQGRLLALRMIRRHRLLEVFLIDVMGFTWDQVDAESHRLEHAISNEFEDRMDRLCNYPMYCPHGDPIPRLDGMMPEQETLLPLTQVSAGERVILRRVGNKDPQVLRYLSQCNLQIGRRLKLIEHAPFKGPITFEVLTLYKSHVSPAANASLDEIEGIKNEQTNSYPQQMLGNELAEQLFVAVTPN